MSLWTKVQQLPANAKQQVRSLYGEHFPIEVRHFLATWIEERFWGDMNPECETSQCEQYAAQLLSGLIQELENLANSMITEELYQTRIKLIEAANMFQDRYTDNPLSLFKLVRHCLSTETKLVQQLENVNAGQGTKATATPVPPPSDPATEIAQQLDYLRRRTQETSEDLRKLEQDQGSFALTYHECSKLNTHIHHLQSQPQSPQNQELDKKLRLHKDMFEQHLSQKVPGLVQLRLTLADKLKDMITNLTSLQNQVLDDKLVRWKRVQQVSENGTPVGGNTIDMIQEWCESLAEITWQNRQQIKEAERLRQKLDVDPPGVVDILPNLKNQISQLLSSLITRH